MKYIDRRTTDIKLNEFSMLNNDEIRLLDSSRLRIILREDNSVIDIGSWCYKKRKRDNRKPYGRPGVRLVIEQSLIENRKDYILSYAEHLHKYHMLGKSHQTLMSNYQVIQFFINWCDNNLPDIFESLASVRNGFERYTEHLNTKIRHGKIGRRSAHLYQRAVKLSLEDYANTPDGSFLSGIPNIKSKGNEIKSTQPPDEKDAAYALALYSNIFEGIYNFLIDFKKYPLKLNIVEEKVWIFPIIRLTATKKMLQNRRNWHQIYYAYNFKKGLINSYEETLANIPKNLIDRKNIAKKAIISANSILNEANSSQYHPRRIKLATLAQQSFIMLFSGNTGMNLCSMQSLIWNENNNEIKKSSQGFKSIKSRAKNKVTEFYISNQFYPTFQKYLHFRSYLLEAYNKKTDLLFFKMVHDEIVPVGMNISHHYNKRLKQLFEIEMSIGTRSWRSHKSDWLVRNTDINTASLILQNTPETVIKSYISGTESQATEEFSNFYNQFTSRAVIKRSNKTLNTSVGQCRDIDHPTNNKKHKSGIMPDCKTPEGCLFCTNYAIVADDEDIRKILSLRYIIYESRTLASSVNHFENIFGKTLKKIQAILKHLEKKSKKTKKQIQIIENEINNEERLSPYWERKLKLLIDLEAIA